MINIKIDNYVIEVGDLDWNMVNIDLYIKRNIITVKENNEIILSSRNKSKEEFFNYLEFLIQDKKILHEIEEVYDDPYKYIEQYEYENSFF